jgi:ribosome-associated protein
MKEETNERISKSAIKRRFKDEEHMAQELAALSDRDLKVLPAGQEVKDEIVHIRGMRSDGAKKRQIKHLAKLIREDSVETILNFLTERKGSHAKATKLHREAERLRDALINEAIDHQQDTLQMGEVWEPDWPGEDLEAVVRRYPVDEGDLRKTVYQYVKSRMLHHYREVFRMIKAAMEKDEMLKKLV